MKAKNIVVAVFMILASLMLCGITYAQGCTDTDGGIDYYEAGKAIGPYDDGQLGLIYGEAQDKFSFRQDRSLNYSIYYDHCQDSATSTQLNEAYCENGVIMSRGISCDYGCKNGACLTTPTCSVLGGMDNCLDNPKCYWDQETNRCYDYKQRCSDPDNGNNIYLQGHTFGFRTYSSSQDPSRDLRIRTGGKDACMSDRQLLEHYCVDGYIIQTAYVDCPNGCKDGACIKGTSTCTLTEKDCPVVCITCEQGSSGGGCGGGFDPATCTCKPRPTCVTPVYGDSDGGFNYYVKGTCTDASKKMTDYCLDDSTLREYVYEQYKCGPTEKCLGAGNCVESHNSPFACPNGCKDGACISGEQTKEQVKCVFDDSKTTQECYSDKGVGCKGTETCVVDVSGNKGEQITWKSSCGGYAYTTIDGANEYAKFSCNGQPTPPQPTNATICPQYTPPSPTFCQDGKIVSGGVDERGCSLPPKCSSEKKSPYCSAIGTRSEGWYKDGKLIKYASCNKCTAVCKGEGTRSEGWYSSCNGELILYEQGACTESNLCTEQYEPVCGSDGKTYSNSCVADNAGVKWIEGACEGTVPVTCEGCQAEKSCLAYGIRMLQEGKPVYCDFDKTFKPQKPENAECQNSYECVSNQCSNGKCIDLEKQLRETQGTLDKIMEWLRSLFGGKKVNGG